MYNEIRGPLRNTNRFLLRAANIVAQKFIEWGGGATYVSHFCRKWWLLLEINPEAVQQQLVLKVVTFVD